MNKRAIRQHKLQSLIDELCNGNVAEFARKIGKEPSYVSRMLYPEDKKGAKPIGEKIVAEICKTLDLPNNWFDNDSDLPTELKVINDKVIIEVLNVEASAGNGTTGDLVEVVSRLYYVPEQYYTLFRGINPDGIRVINIKGDSMSPTFNSGDMVFVNIKIQSFDGDGVYIFNYKNALYIKRLQRIGEKFLVLSDNKTYKEWDIDDENQLFIQGKVIVHQSQKLNFIE
ncbi:S24 family peptidase [Gallibacterium salpingitidis]|uniref:S24 family peptidase n=1 Tax=Gallibacterium salpingitidis TaxID=505341 RepID=UPI0009F1E10E|nr:S24 family peptidase [Gallibacterium salpingitidis]